MNFRMERSLLVNHGAAPARGAGDKDAPEETSPDRCGACGPDHDIGPAPVGERIRRFGRPRSVSRIRVSAMGRERWGQATTRRIRTMSLAEPPPAPLTETEQRIVLPRIGWDVYDAILQRVGEPRPGWSTSTRI